MRASHILLVIASVPLVVSSQAASSAQDLSASFASLAHYPVETAEPFRSCGTPADQLLRTHLAVGQPMADGEALRADQFPRFLTPAHAGSFGFDVFTVLGDHETVTFERRDPSQTSLVTVETWTRTGTSSIAGRLTSIFRPVWRAEVLRVALAGQRWGVDRPYLFWGDVVAPGTARQPVYLQLAPPNLPSSEVVRISDTVQFASHTVNLWIPDFGDARVQGGDEEWDLRTLATTFYQHFADAYETLAVVTQSRELTNQLGFHRNVRNGVAGIGLELFDDTAQYGSASVLQAVEVFPSPQWAENSTMLHQQAHQWGEYTGAWAAAGIVRRGDAPAIHTPLLAPGAVMAGAVLEAMRRVGESTSSGSGPVIELTLPTIQYNPLTLYRMGLIGSAELPTYQVFEDQGQFTPDRRDVPDDGVAVEGGAVSVTASDFITADGIRNGSPVTRVRRAVIYVTRTGLASQAEMDSVNFFAARLAAREGVMSWDRYPSFFEATRGRAELLTGITPTVVPTIEGGPNVAYLPVAPDALVGVCLDDPVPGRISVGQTIRINGSLTLSDRNDYSVVCFRFIRYGSFDVNETFVCGSLSERRFSIPVTFSATEQGTHTIEPFAFWMNSGPQAARSRYGAIVVGDGG